MKLDRSQASGIWRVAMSSPIDAVLDVVPTPNGDLHVISKSPSTPFYDNVWKIGLDGKCERWFEPPSLSSVESVLEEDPSGFV